jgi:hypothetical protein
MMPNATDPLISQQDLAQTEDLIARQREVIAVLANTGADLSLAQQSLQALENLRDVLMRHRAAGRCDDP